MAYDEGAVAVTGGLSVCRRDGSGEGGYRDAVRDESGPGIIDMDMQVRAERLSGHRQRIYREDE